MNSEESPLYRLLYTIFLDSCTFYPPQSDEQLAMGKLWEFEEKGLIRAMEVAEATSEEIERAPAKVKNRMESRLISCDSIETFKEQEELVGIKKLLFPNKQILADNEKRDVRNLFCAQKMGCDLFVTVDNCHILKKADVIKEKLRVRVVTPTQCLKEISKEL